MNPSACGGLQRSSDRYSRAALALPPLWEASIREHQRVMWQEAEQSRRRSALSLSVVTALAATLAPKAAFSATYDQVLTGVAGADTQYGAQTDADGALVYTFQDGDSINVAVDANSVVKDAYGINLDGASRVIVRVGDDGAGLLNVSAYRPDLDSWGTAFAVNVQHGANLTVNGAVSLNARSDDPVYWVRDHNEGGSLSLGVNVYQATATFNGDLAIATHAPAYSRGLWVYQGNVTVNGKTSIVAQGRGENTDGIHNSGGGRSQIILNGDTHIVADGMYPSDNAHGIYNNNQNSRIIVNGNLDVTTLANGSTVFGLRNQGYFEVAGDAVFTASGRRSAFGVANTHWSARAFFRGDLSIDLKSTTGYTPFGSPTAIQNTVGSGGIMQFDKGVTASVVSGALAYGIDNADTIRFTSATDTAVIRASSTADGLAVYGINNHGGTITFAGGLDLQATATGTGTAYLINNRSASWVGGTSGTIDVNAAGTARTRLDGDLYTTTWFDDSTVREATTAINLTGEESHLNGRVMGYAGGESNYRTGATRLTFADGARWNPTGTGTIANDFGAGGLALGAGGTIDLSASWGAFTPGAIPAHSLRTLSIDSSTGNGSVTLEDGAKFLLLSDVRNGTADKIVFGSGISQFSASGTQSIGIVYDPVLEDTSWIDDAAIQVGKWIEAMSEVEVIDASLAAGGAAKLSSVAGLESSWQQTYENDLVAFSYKPTLALSSDGSKVLLTGIQIIGSGEGSTGDGDTGNSGDTGGGDTGDGGDTGGGDTGDGGDTGGGDTGNGGDTGSGDTGNGGDTGSGDTGSGGDTGGGDTGSVGDTGGGDVGNGGDTGGGDVGNGSTEGEIETPAIRPSETVLTAAEAVDGLRSLWLRTAEHTRDRSAALAAERSHDTSGAWSRVTGGRDRVDTAYARQYAQDMQAVSVGVERSFLVGQSASLMLGASLTQGRAEADYARGDGELRSTGAALYAGVTGARGAYLWGSVGGNRLRNQYGSFDSEGRRSTGTARADAWLVALEAGWPIQVGGGWSLTPQVSVATGTLRGERHVTSTGVAVDAHDTDVTQVRAGASLARTFSGARMGGELYLKAVRLQSSGDDVAITASRDGGEISAAAGPHRREGYEFSAGASISLPGKRLSLFAETGHQRYTGVTRDWTASAGLRYRW